MLILVTLAAGLGQPPDAAVSFSFLQEGQAVVEERDAGRAAPPIRHDPHAKALETAIGNATQDLHQFFADRPQLLNRSTVNRSTKPDVPAAPAKPRVPRISASTQIDGLLELSDAVLVGTTEALEQALEKNGSGTGPRHKLSSQSQHAEKLEKLFHVLGDELAEEEANVQLQDPQVAVHGGLEEPQAHKLLEATMALEPDGIEAPSTVDERGFLAPSSPRARHQLAQGVGLQALGCIVAALVVVALWTKSESGHDPEVDPKPAVKAWRSCAPASSWRKAEIPLNPEKEQALQEESKPQGQTSYVIRVVKVRAEQISPSAPLAWQVQYGEETHRRSRFTRQPVWDAPVDGLDIDVDDPTGVLTFTLLANRDALEPPTVVGSATVGANVLLAEARSKTAKVHERRLAVGGGELIFEYSLIAFFHWYVGGDTA